jgi:hypothetical protein
MELAVMSKFTIQKSLPEEYNSFSDVDMEAVIGTHTIGILQCISYTTHREITPIYSYTMGINPRVFARGKRVITGTLMFKKLHYDTDARIEFPSMSELKKYDVSGGYSEQQSLDQIPPFDVVLTAESACGGYKGTKKILGVKLMNNVSINDIALFSICTFLATEITHWIIDPKEDRTGQTYNQYTDTWSWF